MYKIVLVDDEMIEIEALKLILCRNFDNLRVVGEATNGLDAIQVVKTANPDIVVMDIRMPGIDGLKVVEEIKKINPHIRVLMLTAYSSFEYALQSLRLGVDDYLLKPIKRANMIEALKKVIERIEDEGKQYEQNQMLKNTAESMIPYIKNEIFQSIITGEKTSDVISKNSIFLEVDIRRSFCTVLRVEEGHEGKEKVLDIVNDVVMDVYPCLVSDFINNDILMMVPADQNMEELERKLWIARFVNYLDCMVQSKAGTRIVFGVGSIYEGYENLHHSYMEALYALKYGNENDTVRIFNEDTKTESQMNKFIYPYEMERRLVDKILAEDEESVKLVEALFNKIVDIYNSFLEVKEKILEIVIIINRNTYQYVQDSNEIKFAVGDYHSEINELKDVRQLKQWLSNYVRKTINTINRNRLTRTEPIISDAIEYIRSNYKKELTLENVAQNLGISTFYFSRLFKQKTGGNFVDFIAEVRIDKAKELLRDQKRSIKEIAYETGFNSQIYFNKVFKKIVGLTPLEFRDTIQD